ncbi:hypothetical protein B0H13DRAFT_2261982 [Mycena leptocephala]|nr:hypothetical protein B0H13DRAFT_2261982 [Mycena leptocephala]
MPVPRFKDQPLHPGHIEQLPVTYRRVAHRAANGSLDDLWTLRDSISRLPIDTSLRFLPAFYINLDPAGIPKLDDEKPNINAMERALVATEGIYFLQNPTCSVPVSAVRDIWPRYWAWIEFFQIYVTITTPEQRLRLHLGELELKSSLSVVQIREFELGSNVVQFMASFEDSTLLFNLFGATSGVRALLARNWVLLVRHKNLPARDVGLDQVFTCLNGPGHLDASQPAGLEEFIEGAGGTIADLASLIVQTIAVLVPGRKPSIARLPLKFLRTILTFVIATDHIGTEHTPRLCHALWEAGLSLARRSPQDGSVTRTILCAIRPDFNIEFLELLFEAIVGKPPAYSVVRRIEGALLDIEDVVKTSPFAKSKTWADFIDLARERIGIRQALSDRIACSNMTCAFIRKKADFKRCLCSNRYCSEECQIADWRAGHRSVCHVLMEGLDHRESAFIRAVVHRDYELHKASTIYPEQIKVQPVESLESASKELRSDLQLWLDLLSRVRDGEGPMEMHIEMDAMGTMLVPLRMNSSGVHDGMCRIAASLPPAVTSQADSLALLEAVQAVLDGEKDHFARRIEQSLHGSRKY